MSFFTNFKGSYQDIWKAIIRPPRDLYALEELGTLEFSVKNQACKRTDIKLRNKRGQLLECSHFEPVDRLTKQLPCVIYLHGNSSSRIEGLMAMETLLPLNITVFCFDFSGCGYSEGDFISLGWYEQDDVEVVINYLRGTNTVSTLGIWGRSMGAVTALLYAQKDSSVAALVLDSPFANLRLLIDEIAQKHTKIPKLIVNGALGLVRKTIIAKAKFDMNKLSPIDHITSVRVPTLFVAATGDDFIEPHHTRDLYERHPAKKNLILVEGDHNSIRPQHLSESITSFMHTMLLDSQDRQRDGGRFRNRKVSMEDEDYDGSQYPAFKIRGRSNFLTCENELEVCERLKKHCDDELQKAIVESMKLAQINQKLITQSPSGIKPQKKLSTTTDSSGDKFLLPRVTSELEIEDVPKYFKEDEARLNR